MRAAVVYLLLLTYLILVCPVSALSLDFQISGDATDISYYNGGNGDSSVTWVPSSSGGNNYVDVYTKWTTSSGGQRTIFYNKNAELATYAAATNLGGYGSGNVYSPQIAFFDSSGTLTYVWGPSGLSPAPGRWEVIINGGTAYIKKNGVTQTTTSVSTNPSHIGFGVHTSYGAGASAHSYWDDYVYGDSGGYYVVGMPDSYGGDTYYYYLKKDMVNPAASGVYNGNTGVSVSSYNLSVTYSKNNAATEQMYLRHTGTGTIVGVENVSGYFGTVNFPIVEDVFTNSGAQYGSFAAYLSGSPTVFSDSIQYLSGGAWVVFDKNTYTRNDGYYLMWSVDSSYWDTATYSYHLDLYDTYGTKYYASTIDTQSGTGSKTTWPTTYNEGVYYIYLVATDHSGKDYYLWYDTCTLLGYLRFEGVVMGADTAAPLSGCYINISQTGAVDTQTTIADGNYSTNAAFGTGAPILFNVTKVGYRQYYWSKSFEATKTIDKNITLMPNTWKNASGVTALGVIGDSDYDRPLSGVTVTYTNVSHGTSHSVVSDNVGVYLIDNTHSGTLVSGYCYNVNATFVGYTQSYPLGMKCVV